MIRISSDIPIIAYQFNPIDSANVYSNDASLLIPAATLSRYYRVATYKSFQLDEGEYLEFEMAGSHSSPGNALVEANLPVLLVQYIEGQECTDQPFYGA